MFKRVAKATSKKVDADELKDATGDDTAIGIDRLVDESSSSEDEDSEEEDEDSETEGDGGNVDSEQGSDGNYGDADADAEDAPQLRSKRKRSKDDEEDEAEDEAAAQVSIEDTIKDPIYVPTEGEKKHGVFASRCVVCEAAVLKDAHLVTAHLEGKAHKRRMERFQRYVQNHLSETQRKALDARDAVDQMEAWRAEQDELEKKSLAEAPPSKRALAKKQKAAEFRKKKKEQAIKRKAQKQDNGGNSKVDKSDHQMNSDKSVNGEKEAVSPLKRPQKAGKGATIEKSRVKKA
ncbi:uncharacterized protein MEPE_06009 [Melanopsichium pennsylvanicum]|uniref:Uncharacterized protein n=2 Tax=Melanopsichium pennsylvanicum TaxID=63383 RepID=A0AAJ5C8A5_9BASI|nr:conserved hypothetical protein [Melanopsichium pennsylvanicum 4]SNX87299.1 uncharacterized protein MEPE_06009 [Melanopsichium pennsylvanicum]